MRKSWKRRLLIALSFVLLTIVVGGCSSQNSSQADEEELTQDITGRYFDSGSGAGIEFNENNSGRYVFADMQNQDTDDNFSWKVIGKNKLELNMHDKDISKPVIASFDDKKVTLTSKDSNWNAETLTKANNNNNQSLDQFLQATHDNYHDPTERDPQLTAGDRSDSNSGTNDTNNSSTQGHHLSKEEAIQILDSKRDQYQITEPINTMPAKDLGHVWKFESQVPSSGIFYNYYVSDTGNVRASTRLQ